jgi:hypothetical protein
MGVQVQLLSSASIMSDGDWYCDLCGNEIGLESHYHCPNCLEECGMYGHYDFDSGGHTCERSDDEEARRAYFGEDE